MWKRGEKDHVITNLKDMYMRMGELSYLPRTERIVLVESRKTVDRQRYTNHNVTHL